MRITIAHFRTEAHRRKVLAHLSESQRKTASTPLGLAALVKDKTVSESHVRRCLIKAAGMSRAVPPKEAEARRLAPLELGKPFLTRDAGPALLQRVVTAHPKGFRQPSAKAKNWQSTSLMERVAGVKTEFRRSTRGDARAIADREHRELARATQDIRNIADCYLSGTQRLRKAMMPPVPNDRDVIAIRARHSRERAAREERAAA